MRSDSILVLPKNLPVPINDNAADHLLGFSLPSIKLLSTATSKTTSIFIRNRPTIIFIFPRAGHPEIEPPQDWNKIAGARGCTPQLCSVNKLYQNFNLNYNVLGISTQDLSSLKEITKRLQLAYPLYSDSEFKLTKLLKLPYFTLANGEIYLKRITLIININRIIEKVFYPIYPTNIHPQEVLKWITRGKYPKIDMKNTVPFLNNSSTKNTKIFLLDNTEILNDYSFIKDKKVFNKISASLHLGYESSFIPAKQARQLIINQYECCLEHMYSNPFWKNIRNGDKNIMLTYLLENVHYLQASSYRMTAGITPNYNYNNDYIANELAQHAIEEEGHNIFYENALKELGINEKILKYIKPLPTTTEWIHLMKAIAAMDPFSAVLCSGLLEYWSTTLNQDKSNREFLA